MSWPDSLQGRLMLTVLLALAGFLGATGLALDKAFQASARSAVEDRLRGNLYALLAAVDPERGDIAPQNLQEPRFGRPQSGLYARITGEQGERWNSLSLLGGDLVEQTAEQPGQLLFAELGHGNGRLFSVAMAVIYELTGGGERHLRFQVAESARAYDEQIADFRRNLWRWLGGSALLLLVVLGTTVHWGLRPLRAVAEDVAAIENGERERLEGHYPLELRGLTRNLNGLLRHEQTRMERYRNALADLAHSLKTPLAVLSGNVGSDQTDAGTVRDQVRHMSQIVEYQLQRAATSGRGVPGKHTPVRPLLDKLLNSLGKVYAERRVQVDVNVDAEARFHGDEGDLMELMGNLLDNAFKYGEGRVRVSWTETEGLSPEALLTVEDNGPGIEPQRRAGVLTRGVRADSRGEGQGIGLAVVADIVDAYRANLRISESDLGGARFLLHIPLN
ncbi:MAG: hypothetical protein KDH88_13650 [Chromatiales bacterium]|nr:hypothetical protein [Chromatiales bacterium]